MSVSGAPSASSPKQTPPKAIRYLIALRPWTWTAAIVPTVLVSTLMHVEKLAIIQSSSDEGLAQYTHILTTLKLLLVFICIQSGANAVNTVEDYRCGVDKKENKMGSDRALVDGTVGENTLNALGYALLMLGSGIAFSLGQNVYLNMLTYSDKDRLEAMKTISAVFVTGVLLAIFYSAPPFRFKYRALGDIVILVCFGPLLMLFSSIILTGAPNFNLIFPYSIPVGVLTEAILHANNTRDIDNDTKAGITTLATIIGFPLCRAVYIALILSAYATVIYLAFLKHTGLIIVTLTAPIAITLIRNFQEGCVDKMASMDEETAKFHLPFGLLMCVGLYFSYLL